MGEEIYHGPRVGQRRPPMARAHPPELAPGQMALNLPGLGAGAGIDSRPLTPVAFERGLTMRERFVCFHAANPHVYANMRRLALQLRRRGFARCGMQMIVEVLRWSYMTTTGDEFKLNNNYGAYYARQLMDNEPELAGFFEVRTARADFDGT